MEKWPRVRETFLRNRATLITAFSCFALCVVATFTDNGGFDLWAANGVWSLLPAVVVAAMTIASKNVVLALGAGILSGAYLLSIEYLNVLAAFAKMPAAFYGAMESALSGGEMAAFLLRLFAVGAFVALTVQWGGFQAVASLLNRKANIRNAVFVRLGVLFLGFFLYFDAGARAWTQGRVLKPLAEKYGVSRECLAFLSDCSSASVAAILSVWAYFEISLIREGLSAGDSVLSAQGVYAESIPLRFYPILLTAFALFTALFNRENLSSDETVRAQPAPSKTGLSYALRAVFPFALLIVVFSAIRLFMNIELNAAIVPAFLISCGVMACLCTYRNRRDVWGVLFRTIKGMRPVLTPIFAILLSRTFTVVICALEADVFIANALLFDVSAPFFPALVFLLSAAAGYATGSAYVSMALLAPLSIVSMPLPGGEALVCAAALSGGFLGAHCSHASETALLATFGADCPHDSRMKRQIPRVLVVGAIALLLGYIPAGFGLPVWASYLASISATALAAILFERFAPFVIVKEQVREVPKIDVIRL